MTKKYFQTVVLVATLLGLLSLTIGVGAAPNTTTLTPPDDAAGVNPLADLVVAFDETISVGTGNITLHEADGTVIETLDVTGATVNVSGNTVTLSPVNTLAYGTAYYVNIEAGAFVGGSESFEGITNTTEWNFTTSANAPQSDKLTPPTSDAEYRFGWSVAVDGDWMVTGSYGEVIDGIDNVGAAWVWRRDASTNWTPTQILFAPDGGATDEFGWSVDIDGDRLAIGAWADVNNGNEDPGSAYTFVRAGETWVFEQKLVPGETNDDDGFGYDVVLDDDMLLVGAPFDGDDLYGAVYMFTRPLNTWEQAQRITPSDYTGISPKGFGFSIAREGNRMLVGAPFDGLGRGAAYPFTYNGATWTQGTKFTSSDGQGYNPFNPGSTFLGDFFGTSVAMDGTTAVISAWQDINSSDSEGSAYIFTENAGQWTEGQKLIPNADDEDGFGFTVGIAGDFILVSADDKGASGLKNPLDGSDIPEGSGDESGVLYQFNYNGTNTQWELFGKHKPEDNEADDFFGNVFALDGTRALVGAWGDDDAGTNVGAVYEIGIGTTPTITELYLYNADTTLDVRALSATDTIDITTIDYNWGLRANTSPNILQQVAFNLSGDSTDTQIVTNAPYIYPSLGLGSYVLGVTPVAYNSAQQVSNYSLSVVEADLTPPQVASTVPENNAVNVSAFTNPVVNFTKSVTLSAAFAEVNCPSFANPSPITGTFSNIQQYTFSPIGLVRGETCTFTLIAANITDSDGNQLDGNADGNGGDNFTLAFTVEPFTAPDFDENGYVTASDAIYVQNRIGTGDLSADVDGNNIVDADDFYAIIDQIDGVTFLPTPTPNFGG